ncbi:(Fe-S)-binding protein [Desulfurobacterium thermolithotrophum]|uniref:(Fe-S)-binding protein n=1 Tax=Desulfurobacterium thermolithotrophum TaxID=64160 RepID=UPI0013D8A67A|nr:(Fe-S)-binding protein [Desulfurobacterium thermolithotrophum]
MTERESKKKIFGISDEVIEKCVRCGSCRTVCPVFNVTHEEPSVARGKIFLANMINKGNIELDKEAAGIFNLCATCLRCAEICPLKVNYEKIIISARALCVEKFGLSPEKKAAVFLFSNRELLKALGKVAAPLTKIFTKSSKSPQNRLFPIDIPKIGKVLLPEIKSKPFNDKDRWYSAKGKEKGKVAFFSGCMFNNFYTETAQNVVKVLNALGYSVFVPRDQHCCGAPALFAGDLKTFEKMKEKNLKTFQNLNVDFIVTACATCGHILKKEYKETSFKTKELIEVLFENLEELRKWKFPQKVIVTWHHPCHIVRGQKIPRNYPLDVLKVIENIEFVNLEEADNCCGMGGSFKLSHPEISKEIQLKKVRNIEKTKGDFVLTECPGCVMNIAEGLERINSNIKSLHIADILAKCID